MVSGHIYEEYDLSAPPRLEPCSTNPEHKPRAQTYPCRSRAFHGNLARDVRRFQSLTFTAIFAAQFAIAAALAGAYALLRPRILHLRLWCLGAAIAYLSLTLAYTIATGELFGVVAGEPEASGSCGLGLGCM